MPLKRDAFGAEANLDALILENPLDCVGHVGVLARREAAAFFYQGHLRDEASENLSELYADMSAAYDDEAFGKPVERQQRLVGQERDPIRACKGGNQRPPADIDEYLLRRENVFVHAHPQRPDEFGVAFDDSGWTAR
jgi:hypothetical protein